MRSCYLQAKEHNHHGDSGIPAQQRFGGFALSLMAGLGLPIRNTLEKLWRNVALGEW
jgi:hypothetical protein